MSHELGRFVLNDGPSIFEAFQFMDAQVAVDIDAVRRNRRRTSLYPLFDEFFKQFIAAGNRRIDPEAQRRNGIEILTEFFRFFRPIILQPTADEPVLLMISQGRYVSKSFSLSGMTKAWRLRILFRSMALTNLAMPLLPNLVAILTDSLQAADSGTLSMPKI